MSKVYLVGAGPGDPELITCKGRSVLEQADVILYDNLASRALLNFAPHHAERVYVGKKRTEHAFSQDEICRMLIEHVRQGKNVVRLKGGDPFIFGRGGEEAEALADAGIEFEVVPGVTTPLGIAAYCGVPLTHREHTSVVTFITGHDVSALEWDKVAASETIVVFMGLTGFSDIARALIEHGKAADTPAMVVRWATRPDQVTLAGTLGDLPSRIKRHGLKPPATIVVGPVVQLREKLNWYERLPLFGTRIIVTRAAEQAGTLSAKLRALAADVVEFPTIEIRAMEDYGPLDAAIERLPSYDWLIFTSVNGVRYFLERLDKSARDLRSLRARVCAIGPATRQAVENLHLKVDVVPQDYVAESLVKAFDPFDIRGQRMLLARAAAARELLPEELRRRGACVEVVPAYRTVIPENAAECVREVFARKPDWVLFTSSSTVKNFLSVAGARALEGVGVASIGPVTSETARKLGVQVTVEAQPYTLDGLIAAVVAARHNSRP
jgi:uroporphyrinogen III methyltransferase/synthase